MKNIFTSAYRKDYFEGYSIGIDPYLSSNSVTTSDAAIDGFNSGRLEYERMNGSLSEGIPQRIVTVKVLEDFLIAGMLGLPIDTDYYTSYQIKTILVWYQSGIEKYDPSNYRHLNKLLEENGIVLN